jgi:nitrogen fixation/metabolism regulation signal transduction histidine kinase
MEYDILLYAATLLLILFSYLLYKKYRSRNSKIIYLLRAVENNDFAFKFTEVKGVKFERIFNTALNKIKDILAEEKRRIREQERYYELILDNVITGIIAVNKRGDVLQCNAKANSLLGLPVFTSLMQLAKIDEGFPEIFEKLTPEESTTVSFTNERGVVKLSVRASAVKMRRESLKIISMNDIGGELEDTETESWTKLTRVLTHEIMNLTTPIASISDTLFNIYGEKDETLKSGLATISNTSKGLISFVDSYRKFTGIPQPVKRRFNLLSFAGRIKRLMSEDLICTGIDLKLSIDKGIEIDADESQITQVMVNIVKNGIHAIGENTDNPLLEIRAFADGRDTCIDIINNGKPIAPELRDQIFIPFYTSKEEGTGIGLSISRQIMRLHNGTIKLISSIDGCTIFRLHFRDCVRE